MTKVHKCFPPPLLFLVTRSFLLLSCVVSMDLGRLLSLATSAASQASSALSTVASRLLSQSTNTPATPPLPPERPYDGPDILSPLSHDLHAHIFTFLPLRALFASSRLSSTFSSLASHPTCD